MNKNELELELALYNTWVRRENEIEYLLIKRMAEEKRASLIRQKSDKTDKQIANDLKGRVSEGWF